jgi:hypothetical protein
LGGHRAGPYGIAPELPNGHNRPFTVILNDGDEGGVGVGSVNWEVEAHLYVNYYEQGTTLALVTSYDTGGMKSAAAIGDYEMDRLIEISYGARVDRYTFGAVPAGVKGTEAHLFAICKLPAQLWVRSGLVADQFGYIETTHIFTIPEYNKRSR